MGLQEMPRETVGTQLIIITDGSRYTWINERTEVSVKGTSRQENLKIAKRTHIHILKIWLSVICFYRIIIFIPPPF